MDMDGATRRLPAEMRDRLIVALDLDSVAQAEAMAERLAGTVSFFKLGLGLLFAPGVDRLIDRLTADGGRLFLDVKLHDIPQTVSRAVRSIAARGVSLLTVHAEESVMRAAVAARGDSPMQIFAVTVLTSLDDASLDRGGHRLGATDLVRLRARLAVACGCDGIIASAADAPDEIRRHAGAPGLLIATPGIRLDDGSRDDQQRIATPQAAIAAGADYLVVGRPIAAAPDPVAAAQHFLREMEDP